MTRIIQRRDNDDEQVTAWQGVSANLSTSVQAASDAAAIRQAAIDRLRAEIHAAEEQAPAPDSPQQRPSSPEYAGTSVGKAISSDVGSGQKTGPSAGE
ncbi:hypothetical protein CF326_g7025 [Tilletia indica]|nr:hypothetical protein CF326_g7025 [Tilletia indica]